MEKANTAILFTNKQAFHLSCMVFFLPHFNVTCDFSVLSISLFFPQSRNGDLTQAVSFLKR